MNSDRKQDIYNHLLNLAISRFTWTNLPPGLTSEHLEYLLMKYGQLACYDNELGTFILPCHPVERFNVYGLATKYYINSLNGEINIKKDVDDIIILKNNPIAKGDLSIIEYYSNVLSDIDSTEDVNLFQQNIPKIIVTDENSKLTAKNIIRKLQEFKVVIYAKKGISNFIEQSNILDNTAPFLLDKLQDYRIDKYNEILSLLGINNANTEKKERLITDEVNANNDFIQINIDLMYDLRKKFCDDFNKKYNSNLKVEKREVTALGEIHSTFNSRETDRE